MTVCHAFDVRMYGVCQAGPMVDEPAIDIVGVGALNLDLIADGEQIATHDRDGVWELFSVDRESFTQDLDGFLQVVASIRRCTELRAERGGSAFNTLHALGAMRMGLRLGYVGVAAAPPPGLVEILGEASLPSARDALAAAGIDQGGVVDGSSPGGLGVSVVRGAMKSLRTCYDQQVAAVLAPRLPELRAYLRRAHHIHVSSLPGAETVVADLVESVLDGDHGPTVSVDPGETWARFAGAVPGGQSDVGRLLALADLIFVNRAELTYLAGTDNEDPIDAARAVLERFASGGASRTKRLVIKSVTHAYSYALQDGQVVADRVPQRVLPPTRIVDSTGAGDVFAAGVLAVLGSDRGRIAAGMALGLAASRRKMQRLGADGYQNLDGVLFGSPDPLRRTVFVSHSRSDHSL